MYFNIFQTLSEKMTISNQIVFQKITALSTLKGGKGFCFMALSEIGKIVGLTYFAVGKICKKLANEGLILRWKVKDENGKQMFGWKTTQKGLALWEQAKAQTGEYYTFTEEESKELKPLKAIFLKILRKYPNQSQKFYAQKLAEVAGKQSCAKTVEDIANYDDRRTVVKYQEELIDAEYLKKNKASRVGEMAHLVLTPKYQNLESQIQEKINSFLKTKKGIEYSNLIDNKVQYQLNIIQSKSFKANFIKKIESAINDTKAFMESINVPQNVKIDIEKVSAAYPDFNADLFFKYFYDSNNQYTCLIHQNSDEIYKAKASFAFGRLIEHFRDGLKNKIIRQVPQEFTTESFLNLLNKRFSKIWNEENSNDNFIIKKCEIANGKYLTANQVVLQIGRFIYKILDKAIKETLANYKGDE